jgi:hypothetical protein
MSWTLGKPVKLVEDEGDWSEATLALIERAKSLGLTLASVGKEPWGWELRYADGSLIVHGNTEVIEATIKDWPHEEPEGWTVRVDGVVYPLKFRLAGLTEDGKRLWRTYFPAGKRSRVPDYGGRACARPVSLGAVRAAGMGGFPHPSEGGYGVRRTVTVQRHPL